MAKMLKVKSSEERRSPQLFPMKKFCGSDLFLSSDEEDTENIKICQPTPLPPVPQAKRKKSVSFCEKQLAEVIEFEDDAESKDYRKRFWEVVAADRFRFKYRIEQLEGVLCPVLTSSHRNIIYTRRVLTLSPPLISVNSPGESETDTCAVKGLKVENMSLFSRVI